MYSTGLDLLLVKIRDIVKLYIICVLHGLSELFHARLSFGKLEVDPRKGIKD